MIPTHITLDHPSSQPADIRSLATKAITWPARLLRAPVDALNRRREAARAHAELAALDDRLLADIGLRRAPADQLQAINGPCG